ncbi:class I SAM-dependent methyltransferase [Williamsia sp. MIQD14]|uniref:class I SAM-dependent methyltransferase n=1 Tax=Williamsia sp. MIQD14 TaxID=3425703 RepID=UPI003DA086B7
MTVDIASVGTTAVVTAQMRALESTRSDRLFEDELAADLVRAAGLGIENISLDQVDGQRVYVSLAVRTHFLDCRCRELLADGSVRQVVLLGAGLDTRAVRLSWLDAGIAVYEIDRSDVVALKVQELGLGPHSPWRGVATDLTGPSWVEDLVSTGFDVNAPTVFIAEGLFMYLKDDESLRIVDAITSLAVSGSHLLAVHFGRGALLDAETQAMSAATGNNGYAFESVIETTPADWLGDRWSVRDALSIAEYAPTVGRQIPYDEESIGDRVTWMFAAGIVAQ